MAVDKQWRVTPSVEVRGGGKVYLSTQRKVLFRVVRTNLPCYWESLPVNSTESSLQNCADEPPMLLDYMNYSLHS